MAFDLENLVRDNIKRLVPYSSARSEHANGNASIFLDANENAFGSPIGINYNRYPDPQQTAIKEKVTAESGIPSSQIFIGNGSDEAIDLLLRIFCRPAADNILICPPTYGMYEVAAGINDTAVRRVNLTDAFQLDVNAIKLAYSENTKLIFLCSPNNPTANLLDRESMLVVIDSFDGIVVVDEAYIQFADGTSFIDELHRRPNLVVLQTFSKAWGLAGLRIGLAFANKKIIDLFNKVKPPYNVSQPAQQLLLEALQNPDSIEHVIERTINARKNLERSLTDFRFIEKVYPSDTNFLLVKVSNAGDLYRFLIAEHIVVRNRSNVVLCDGCLRITVGTEDENRALLNALEKYETSLVY